MRTLFGRARVVLGALAVIGLVALAVPAAAQQSGGVNPTASSVNEDQLLNQLKIVNGRGSIPDTKSYNIEQPGGRDWRQFHQVTLPWLGAIAILGMLALLAVFYLVRSTVKLKRGRSGRTIVRFTGIERFIHWMTATSFVILGLSGLNVTFGKFLLLPLLGPESFTAFSQWAKYAHNFLSFPFTLGVVAIFLMWVGQNFLNRVDIDWIRRGGGIIGSDHPPAYRFNAGQKIIYWLTVFGGVAAAATGYLLMFPFYATDIAGMQTAQMIHGIVAMLYVALILGHIYIGTLGMEGAFEGMGSGEVDVNWAREHHALWLEQEMARTGPGNAQTQASATPAE
jgi:formate dehydrogenase subunit gamma